MTFRLFERESDEAALRDIYANTPHAHLALKPEDFVGRLGWRIYTEWCMSGESRWDEHRIYSGQAFEKFVDDETRYEGLRREHAGEKGVWSPEAIRGRRSEVLKSIVLRSIQFFEETGGETYRPQDRVNLRCDLKPWLEQLSRAA